MHIHAKLSLLALTFNVSAAWALQFDKACDPASDQIIIGGVGDFLMHTPLQKAGNTNGYATLWKGIQYRIDQVGLMYANLETPVAPGVTRGSQLVNDPGPVFDNKVYSNYPMFNTPPALLSAIKSSGFHILSTANNHAMDRGKLGADRTIEQLRNVNLPFTGTRTSGSNDSYATIIHRGGFSIGFISCTFSLNGFSDKASQVLQCYDEKGQLMSEIRELRRRVDAVIVTPHWGEEYEHSPRGREKQLAREMIEAGATAVIGTHPHVIQPAEKYKSSDGREGYIAYSTGNFISGQSGVKRIGLMVFLGLSKTGRNTWVNGARYAPTFMTSPSSGVYFLDNTKAIKEYSGLVSKVMNDTHGHLGSKEPLYTNPECQQMY